MQRRVFVILIIGMSIMPLASIFGVWYGGVFPNEVGGAIAGSERFIDVLKQENVSAWLHGHIGSRHTSDGVRVDKYGTAFINAASIIYYPESLFLIFENGERHVTVRSRNHEERRWNKHQDRYSFELEQPFNGSHDTNVIWVYSDTQPVNEDTWGDLETAIRDTNNLTFEPDAAFMLGDLVNEGRPEQFRSYNKRIRGSNLPRDDIYHLAGNHDFSRYFSGNLDIYREYVRGKLNYAVDIGNVRFILMSDRSNGITGHIKDETVRWWERNVVNEGGNIVTLTHQPLQDTTEGSEVSLLRFLENKERRAMIILPHFILISLGIFIAWFIADRKNSE